MPWQPETRTESNVLTNSIKIFKTVHIKKKIFKNTYNLNYLNGQIKTSNHCRKIQDLYLSRTNPVFFPKTFEKEKMFY